MICSRKGYPRRGRDARQRDARAHAAAADVRRQDHLLRGSQGLQRRGREGARDGAGSNSRYYMPYQYGNQANPLAHYNGTAPEILEELDEVTAFVAGLGTGGTLMGNGRRLTRGARRQRQDRRRRADAGRARPGPALAGRRLHPADHRPRPAGPQDLRHEPRRGRLDAPAARRGGHLRRRLLGRHRVDRGAHRRRELDEGNIVFIVCDDGWKYLSSGIYTRPVEEIEDLDSTIWW